MSNRAVFFCLMHHHIKKDAGYSLVEMLLVVVIVALIAALSMPFFGYLRAKAGSAACISHLRVIGVGLNTYLLDHDNVWPQVPEALLENDEEEVKWWITTLKSHGVGEPHWVCPSDPVLHEKAQDDKHHFVSSYLVTMFDDLPNTAFAWQQPWVLETGSFHGDGKGPNMLMPDGSIQQGAIYMGK